jgi:predicted Zn-dependent protease
MISVLRLRSTFRLYREWISRWHALPVPSWIRGAEHYRAGRYEQAEVLYRRGLEFHHFHPARVSALLDLSHCLFRLRKLTEAEATLRQAVFSAPNERETYVRLARLQLWLGYATEAAWTMRSCLQRLPADPELISIFLTAVVESGGVSYLVREARDHLASLHAEPEAYPRLEVAKARFEMIAGDSEAARVQLAHLAALDRGPFDAVVAFAEVLLNEGKVAYARHHLHRALIVSPEHPRVLALLARTYSEAGAFFDPEFSIQLATKACQATAWKGIHEMHVLAQAYALFDDKISALLVASKAKDTGRRLLGSYREAKTLDQLIHRLSAGTHA